MSAINLGLQRSAGLNGSGPWHLRAMWRKREADQATGQQRQRLLAEARKAKHAAKIDKAFPRREEAAAATFIDTMLIETPLPLDAVAHIAWWLGLATAQQVQNIRGLRRLLDRHW